jgi:hypothetical protein
VASFTRATALHSNIFRAILVHNSKMRRNLARGGGVLLITAIAICFARSRLRTTISPFESLRQYTKKPFSGVVNTDGRDTLIQSLTFRDSSKAAVDASLRNEAIRLGWAVQEHGPFLRIIKPGSSTCIYTSIDLSGDNTYIVWKARDLDWEESAWRKVLMLLPEQWR